MSGEPDLWTLVPHLNTQPVRILHLEHVNGDTFAITEDGEVSLSDRATLISLLDQLNGKEPP